MNKFGDRFLLFFSSEKKLYLIGLLFTLIVTFLEVSSLSYNNFQIFSYGSLDFWSGVNPYSDWTHLSLRGKPLDVFLYGPVFCVLFTPFTLLGSTLGAFCWNIFTYSVFFLSVFTLPSKYGFVKQRFIFLYVFLLLINSVMSMQFNPLVAAMFLFAFSLLERDKGFWAVFIIMVSGTTKIYGFFQLGMLLFYPRFWSNAMYALLIAGGLVLLPLVRLSVGELIPYYRSWIDAVSLHADPGRFQTIYRPFFLLDKSFAGLINWIAAASGAALYILALCKLSLFKTLENRGRFLGVLMCWAILFGTGSENNTYVIALTGYALWYVLKPSNQTDKILLWCIFVFFVLMPSDVFCPQGLSDFILYDLCLGVIVLGIAWFRMVYLTFFTKKGEIYNLSKTR